MSQMRLPLRVVFVLLPLLILASGCATPLTKPQALLGVGDKPSGQIHVIDLKETEIGRASCRERVYHPV